MGDVEVVSSGAMEPTLRYHSVGFGDLTSGRDPAGGHGQAGSLTGAVASQRVTEAPKGRLRLVGNQPQECIGRSRLNCETYMSSRDESRAK